MFVDGVKVDPSTFGKLDPKQIESINVIKGPAAAKLYSDPAAENGVIAIKTKKGGSN